MCGLFLQRHVAARAAPSVVAPTEGLQRGDGGQLRVDSSGDRGGVRVGEGGEEQREGVDESVARIEGFQRGGEAVGAEELRERGERASRAAVAPAASPRAAPAVSHPSAAAGDAAPATQAPPVH